jgi:protein-disulfide isomerase
MEKKTWIIFGAVIVAFIGIIFAFNQSGQSSQTKIDVADTNIGQIIKPSAQDGKIGDHVFGKADSKVVLIEYGDYQCNACAYAFPRINAIAEEYKDHVAFVFRNYPIPQSHPNALTAATVAEAAGLQGKFYEMHDALYENQEAWISSSIDNRLTDLFNLAASIGIDKKQLEKDVKSEETKKRLNQKINFDIATAKKFDIQGTPSFYLNGKEVDGKTWGDDAKLKELLNKALKENGVTPPK